MQDFRSLQVWQKAYQLTLRIYEETVVFPDDEKYGLTSQLRRSAASIGANIAEGCGRGTQGDLRRHLMIAMGSATETEFHLQLARDLNYLGVNSYDDCQNQIVEVKKMLAGLVKRIKF
jgi:four helix bundle protein